MEHRAYKLLRAQQALSPCLGLAKCACFAADPGGKERALGMRTMDRYLLREHLFAVFFCLTGFSMIYIIYDLFDHLARILEAKTPVKVVLRYYIFSLAPSVDYLMPACLLLATLYTLWQLTRHNELTAMRACGVGLYRIMYPFLWIGFVASLLGGGIREFVAPHASFWADEIRNNRFKVTETRTYRDVAFYNTEGRRVWLVGKYDVKKSKVLHDVTLTMERPDGTRDRQVTAPKAEWMDGRWWFHAPQVQRFDLRDNPEGKPEPEPRVPDQVVEMPGLTETDRDFIQVVKPWEYFSLSDMLYYLRSHPRLSRETRAHKLFDIHSRVAIPWACLIVTLFAIPAGAKHGRQSPLTSVFLAIAFFFAFYAAIQVGVFLGKKQLVWPWLGAWLPNIGFMVAGVWMLRRMR